MSHDNLQEMVVELGQVTQLTLGQSGPDTEYTINGGRPYTFQA